MSTRLLVSVRTLEEALLAANNGADFIDLKEPRSGALGGLPPATVRAIAAALRAQGCRLPISATIGDLPMRALPTILQRCAALADCGVDYVKVGILPEPGAAAVLDALAALAALAGAVRPLLPSASPATSASKATIVPVFIADHGISFDLVTQASAAATAFPALMVDTVDKLGGSLFDRVPLPALRRFVQVAGAGGAMVGLAGALRLQHLPALAALAPSFAGFRSAVCAADRGSALDVQRLRELALRMRTLNEKASGPA